MRTLLATLVLLFCSTLVHANVPSGLPQQVVAALNIPNPLKHSALTMVFDHGIFIAMESMSISKFKATCLAVLERVRKTGKPIRITRFGKPVAEIVPPSPERKPEHWLGSMKSTARIEGDIVSPALEPEEWEILRK